LAFGRPQEACLVDRLRDVAHPQVSLVADREGQVVGHILFTPVTIESGLVVETGLGLAPMAVLPQYQRQGIGTRLVWAGLQRCRQMGYHLVVVLGHAEYYPRFGFVPAAHRGLHCEYDVPDDVFMVAELQPGTLAGRRGMLKYHPAFRDLCKAGETGNGLSPLPRCHYGLEQSPEEECLMPESDICFLTATELARRIRVKDLSAREVMAAHLAQIARVNPKVNAIVTLLPEQAMEQARQADEALARGEEIGPLHGLPIAHKDLVPTKGIRTTYGSRIYQDNVPAEDGLIVERLKQAGAITIGKTNTPEFGAGSQTFNEVFGATLNPYDTTKTCGGSSGGAAVALACGMLPIADGSDTGGSLRNPANFCNVVGFRNAPGRVPVWPSLLGWWPISVQGPMARTVQDTALMLSAIAGPDPRSPIAIAEPGSLFRRPLEREFTGVRLAWSPDLGGLPVDPRTAAVLHAQRQTFEALGCIVEEAVPDFTHADEIFKAWRAWRFEVAYGELLKTHRHLIKDTVIWNTEAGMQLTGPALGRVERQRTELYHRLRQFMETHEFLILPVSQVPPFEVNQPYVTEINGIQMETYIDWMKSCYYITVTGHPAISVPAGFTPEGLPVGVQIVGRHQDDFGVLQLAYAFEQATGVWKRRPSVAV
jgi:amidase